MRKKLQKLTAIILSLAITVSVLAVAPFTVGAYANIDSYPDFDVDAYVAGLMTDSDNPLCKTINDQISLDSPNDVVIKQLKDDSVFQASYAGWKLAAFSGGDAVSDSLTEVGYYQSLILNVISEALTSSPVEDIFDNAIVKDAKHLQSTFTNTLKLDFVFTDLNDLNIAEMSQDKQMKVMEAFSSSFEKTYPKVKDVDKFVGVFNVIVKEGKNIETAINNLVAYCESVGMTEHMKAVVADLYKNCDSSNVAMKSALFEINKACQSYTLAYSAALFDLAGSSLTLLCGEVVDTMVDGIMAANPAGLSVMIGQAIGKGVANFLFSTDAICEQYHKMCCLYEFEELLGKVTKLEMNSFSGSKTNYNANKIFSAVDFLYKEYEVSCDLAKKYADIIFKESIAGIFILNSDGYNNYISSVEGMRSIAESNYDFLKGDAWTYFLEEDYPDIYNALIKEDDEIKNPYVPVTGIAFEKSSVEWGTKDSFLNYDKATITPSNASLQSIEYTSSDPSVVSYNKFGAVVHKAGKATVTATSVSSGLTATLNVTVVDGYGADGIALEDPNPGVTANGKCGDNVYWTLYSDGTLFISGSGEMYDYSYYTSYAPWYGYEINTVIIGSGVTSIGRNAFSGCKSLKSITIPDSVIRIRNYAFFGCDGLTSITIPDSVTRIGSYAFEYCDSLTSIKIGNGVTSIGDAAFEYCTSLKSIIVNSENQSYCDIDGVLFSKDKTELITYPKGKTEERYTIPDSVTSIGDSVFYNCDSLNSITIPDGVTSIGEYAFGNCTSLESITIPDSMIRICDSVFYNCDSLNSITIPDGVTSIGDSAFESCNSLNSVIIGNGVTSIGSSAFYNCTSLTSITIPDSVTSIGEYAFRYCGSLTSITIPDSVTSIGYSAFEGCTSLESITIPDSVTSIGSDAFRKCRSLISITIPDSVTSIGSSAFDGTAWCNKQPDGVVYIGKVAYAYKGKMPENTSVVLKDDTKGIAASAFEECRSLNSITIPDSVTSIGHWAFGYCKSLESITIPESVTSIGDDAFRDCTSLESVIIPDSVTSIGGSAFMDCTSLKSITIPDSVTSIGVCAFEDCTSLKSVTIGNGVTSIGDSAFYGCTSLTSVTIGNGVTSIGGGAFWNCTSLTSITIPDSVTSIGDNAFLCCTSLENITIPDSVTIIGEDAFNNTAWYNTWYNNQPDGVVYVGKVAYAYKGEMPENTSIVLEDGTKGIAGSAFAYCENLKSITIPDGVTSIEGSAFRDCTSLESITIPDNVTSIGSFAFDNCTSLKNITIPERVTSIGGYAFYYCESLTSIKIGNGVTSIGSSAFSGCTSLEDVYYSGSKADWNNIDIGWYNDDLTNADIHYNSNGPEADEVVITDKNTDISVTIKNEAELSVKKLTDNESIGKANAVLESGEKLDSLFDISLTKDGTAVQPDGTATVKIPTDNENAKVYRIEDNGTKTDMNAVYSDGYMVFTTEHFSLYALVVPKDTVVIIGDVDGNGTIDVSDATAIQKMVAGSITFTPDQMSVADVNNDGEVSVIDVTLIQKYAAGVIIEF